MTAAYLSPPPVFRGFDNNGNPLVGGFLYTYAAGTSTPVASYTDSTASTPNTNPVVLNSRGECNLWFLPNQSYKLALTDSQANPIWTVDQVINTLPTFYGGVDTGAVNAYVLTFNTQYNSYTNGFTILFVPANTNTGASTVNVNGLGPIAIDNTSGSALAAGEIVAGVMTMISYYNGVFQLLSALSPGQALTAASYNVSGTALPANGLGLPSANKIAFTTNGVSRMTIDGSGNLFFNIAETSATFQVSSGASGSLAVANNGCVMSSAGTNTIESQMTSGGAPGTAIIGPSVSGGTGAALTLSGGTNEQLIITGSAAGTEAIVIQTAATTGAHTATFSATNKPGSGTTAPTNWLPISCDGTLYYIPLWQ